MESLSAANTQFSLNLFKKISEGNASENVFFSPLSISSALAMLSLGAAGNTAAQILQVLGLSKLVKPEAVTPATKMQQTQQLPVIIKTLPGQSEHKTEDSVHTGFNKLMSELNKPEAQYALSLANRLYGEKTYQFVDNFLSDAKKYYQAGLEVVDFKGNAEDARVNINTWVEKNTKGKIKDLLAKGTVDQSTKMVLVNAIYFKGNWEKKFNETSNSDELFKLNKNQTKQVKMMNQQSKFPLAFIEEMNSQVLELPYVGKNLSMLIILPVEIEDDTTGLQKLERTLTYEKLMEWTSPDKMSLQEVLVSLPKFKMEQTYDMSKVLASMGMVDAFENPDFSAMSPSNDLGVSGVVHKSFIEVNEEGTEAAAATGIIMVTTSIPIPRPFNADHPFLFFIRHNPTNSILFYGRFCSP